MDLLGWEPPSPAADPAPRGPMALVIPRLISAALAKHNREEVAHSMSVRLDRRVSKTTLDSWAAPGKPENRIPLDAVVALVAITGDTGILTWLAGMSGHVLVASQHAEVVNDVVLLRQIEAKEQALAAAKEGPLNRLSASLGRAKP